MVRAPYDAHITRMSLHKEGVQIFSRDINLCDQDGKCEQDTESSLSCPTDCPPDKEDGFCLNAKDRICDPDCYKGVDPDCQKPTEDNTSTYTSAIAIALILIAILGLTTLTKKR